jgi:4-amino-4-deoxy-L-arabinose transferase-like glycosyltransferase
MSNTQHRHELEPQSGWSDSCEIWFEAHSSRIAILVLSVGLAVRLFVAWGTFLNPDEALHYLIANQASWRTAYKASLTTAHPPLLILLLYFWRILGTSEFVLRLPSVLAGTGFCWAYFKWLTSVFGRAAGWIGFILATFLPPMISLSAEVRQYMLMLFFIASAAYLLERALAKNSAGLMLLFAICLYLGLLSHYSAFLFAATIGAYGLWRLISGRSSGSVITAWIASQAGVLGIAVFLYVTHISKQKSSAQTAQAMEEWLRKSYYHPGHDSLLLFVLGRSFGVFQFIFGYPAIGDIAGLLFLAAVILLLREKNVSSPNRPSTWQLAVLLLLPFALNCAAAIMKAYPYGGTRHCVFLVIFALAGVSFVLARWVRQHTARGVGVAILIVAACNVFGAPHRPYMLRRDQSSKQMNRVMSVIRRDVSSGSLLFMDYQTSLLLSHYLCSQRAMSFDSSITTLQTFDCGGYRIISADPHTWRFENQTFLSKWDEMERTYDLKLKSGDNVWVIQAGWDIKLATDLQNQFREFRNLHPESFGRNITMFEFTVGQPMPRTAEPAAPLGTGSSSK